MGLTSCSQEEYDQNMDGFLNVLTVIGLVVVGFIVFVYILDFLLKDHKKKK